LPLPSRQQLEERLLKILQLEVKRGYDDRAVSGGLDRFLRNFIDRFPQESPFVGAIVQLPTHGYASLNPAERASWIESLGSSSASFEVARPAPLTAAGAGVTVPPARMEHDTPPLRHQRQAIAAVGGLDSPITRLSIRGTTATKIARIKRPDGPITTVEGLLTHWPFRHIDYGKLTRVAELQPGDRTTLARVHQIEAPWRGNRGRPIRAVLTDGFGRIDAVWFNQPWVAAQIKQGQEYVFSGRVGYFNGRLQFENPEQEPATAETLNDIKRGRLVPVYPSTAGLPQRTLQRAVWLALKQYLGLLPELLPAAIRRKAGLLDQQPAVSAYHNPTNWSEFGEAKRRLGFDEFFVKQLVVLARRRQWQSGPPAPNLSLPDHLVDAFQQSLPFELTDAQARALEAIRRDLASQLPMSRLLQGDVGSGKTVVAAAGLLAAVHNGYQAVLMAPTEILAEQHFRTLSWLLGGSGLLGRPIKSAHLTGGQKASQKADVRNAIAAGEIDVAVGTHALIQETVEFARLGFAVVDEQHRFGVVQRDALKQKGQSPHLLVMTATPIPRTLSLTVYGDLDTSIIDELPPGRERVETQYIAPADRARAYSFVRGQVREGRQAFVICPLVEESEAIEATAAVGEYERLGSEVFPDLRLALLHGRMSSKEKDRVMAEFRDGEADILVSTSVIEVGIDIPNATVMMIEGADRFGLAQLHQFRGRVGRGSAKSYCLLLADDPSDEARERLQLVVATNDGFMLAEEDLRIRGEGEYYGVRQSGLADFRIARLTDTELLEQARAMADQLLDENPRLEGEEYVELRRQVTRFASSRNILLAFH
jgi:ATP-dependent DNA helicase RecG